MSFPHIHRVVTGHDAEGRAIVINDGPLPTVVEITSLPGFLFHEVWSTKGAPVLVDNGPEPTLGPLILPPPPSGTRIRFCDFPAEVAESPEQSAARMHALFAQIGDAKALTVKADSPHAMMHRTESVDYGVVIEGEITLVLDDSEVPLHVGSVVVQRGTNHAWANRSGRPCRMMFILIDGSYEPAIRGALAKR